MAKEIKLSKKSASAVLQLKKNLAQVKKDIGNNVIAKSDFEKNPVKYLDASNLDIKVTMPDKTTGNLLDLLKENIKTTEEKKALADKLLSLATEKNEGKIVSALYEQIGSSVEGQSKYFKNVLQAVYAIYSDKDADVIGKKIIALHNKVSEDKAYSSLLQTDPKAFFEKHLAFVRIPAEDGKSICLYEAIKDLPKAQIRAVARRILSSDVRASAFVWTDVAVVTEAAVAAVAAAVVAAVVVAVVFGAKVAEAGRRAWKFEIAPSVLASFKRDLKTMRNIAISETRSSALLRQAVKMPSKVLLEKRDKEKIVRQVEYKASDFTMKVSFELKGNVCRITSAGIK